MDHLKTSKDHALQKQSDSHTNALQQFQKRYLDEINSIEELNETNTIALKNKHEGSLEMVRELLESQDKVILKLKEDAEYNHNHFNHAFQNCRSEHERVIESIHADYQTQIQTYQSEQHEQNTISIKLQNTVEALFNEQNKWNESDR